MAGPSRDGGDFSTPEDLTTPAIAAAVDAMLDPVGIYAAVRDADGVIVDFRIDYVNAATVEGGPAGSPEAVTGRTLRELFPYLDTSERLSDYARVVETREPLDLQAVRIGTPDVDERVFDLRVAPFQDGIILVTRDVTERERNADELAISEARLNAAQRVGRIGSWETDETGHTIWSEELYRMFGADPGDRQSPDVVMKRTIAIDDRLRLQRLIADLWSTGVPVDTEYAVVTQHGERRWFSARAEMQVSRSGPIVRGVVQDISDRRELERALTTLTADLQDERAAAEVLQLALLPQALPDLPGARVHAVYEPAGHSSLLGGDWYDAFVLADGRLAFTVGDVAGHGLAAAATMSELRHAIRAFASAEPSPGAVVTQLSTMFATWSREPYATCLFAVLDTEHATLSFANAGHLPMLVRSGSDASFVESMPGPPLGAAPYEYPTVTVSVAQGDLYLLYTDGLIERRDEAIDESLHRLDHALVALAGLPARDVCERLVAVARESQGEDQRPDDDICVLAVEVGDGGATPATG